MIDEAGTVVETNPAAALLLEGAVPGANMLDAVPDWLARAHLEAVVDGRRPAREHRDAGGPPSVSGRIAAHSFEAHPTRSQDGKVVWWLVDDTDRRLAEETLATERERTRFLAEASSTLLASLNTDRCMAATAQMATEFLADVAVVVAPPSGSRLPVAHGVAGREVTRTVVAADPSGLPGLSEALQGFPPVPSRWIDPAALPDWVVPQGFDGTVRSVVVTPLPGHGVPAGALILLRSTDHAQFSENEEIFARLFAARAGAALSASRLYSEQSAITRTLMRDLLPPRLERLNGVEIAGGYRAAGASERVGGDFYDVHPGSTTADASLVVLGDVCGKGLDAAVLTGKIRNTLQALVPMADDHERVLQLLNGALLTSHHTRFATLVLASVQRAESQVRLRLTSAGHPAPLVVRTDGSVEEVPTRGSLIGALPTIEARSVETVLQPGETCLLYTDGFTEARGGPLGDELFGEERLKKALSECAGMPGEAVVERIQMLASQWLRDGSHDDMAVVVISAPHTAHLGAVNGRARGRYTA
ncbi:PP2C family protein-serine/threonine phosphatase [Streptomyces sp. NEAU-W12]|nr:PP2C family protein-serine/threonine phosphatase [Streptomyces sp. NEAU-W12]MCX2927051.1 PP2C family protein-serine/threonine phosphatase [Streptomyces sp. NEAU-W12]